MLSEDNIDLLGLIFCIAYMLGWLKLYFIIFFLI